MADDLTPERLEEIAALYAMRPEHVRGADDAVVAELLAGCKARDAEIERLRGLTVQDAQYFRDGSEKQAKCDT